MTATGERWVGIFLLAALLFSPPFLSIADQHEVLGIPFLYLYLFLSWGLVIALLALAVERGSREAARQRSESPQDAETGGED